MILVAYRHGLRALEVCDLQWQQIELSEGRLHVHRVKNGIPSVHPIRGDEMRALRKLRRDYPKDAYVFVSERGGPISGESVIEHVASAEDYQLALATFRAACERWPGTPITLRQGARVIEDSRRLRMASWSDKGRQGGR